ncbi:MAG: hypothetical protein JNK79_19260 [Chitinophagaceae bacterium]|nr:hypothetical protein [Chitinophagaceae bacterium]
MRINFTSAAVALSMTVICLSCSKSAQQNMVLTPSSPSPHVVKELNASLTPDGIYELVVPSEDVQIHKQAVHFELSLIGVDAKNGSTKYKYVPAKGFTGNDEVTLSETRYTSVSGGCNYNEGEMTMRGVKNTTFTLIKFTVK